MSTQPTISSATSSVAIFEPQNVQTIVRMGPEAYQRNTSSHAACLAAGNELLRRLQAEGMSDPLDQEIAKFINKAKITLKNMNDRRSPVTQLFDQLRKVYTTLENEVDPAKSGSVAYQLQAARNAYAAKKREEAERIRREEAARQAAELARQRYRQDVEEDYKKQANNLIVSQINLLNSLDRSVTLDNYADVVARLGAFDCELPASWVGSLSCTALIPLGVNLEQSRKIQASVLSEQLGKLKEQYTFEVGGTRDDILDRLPSKKLELQRIAKASAEEAARIQAELRAREAEEAVRKEQERAERQQQEKAAAELAAQKCEMDGLFGAPLATPAYEPKASVKKRVVISSPDDIMAIVAFWWSQEGQSLPLADLVKAFKKQIAFTEKAANAANPILVTGLLYEDEVKAR